MCVFVYAVCVCVCVLFKHGPGQPHTASFCWLCENGWLLLCGCLSVLLCEARPIVPDHCPLLTQDLRFACFPCSDPPAWPIISIWNRILWVAHRFCLPSISVSPVPLSAIVVFLSESVVGKLKRAAGNGCGLCSCSGWRQTTIYEWFPSLLCPMWWHSFTGAARGGQVKDGPEIEVVLEVCGRLWDKTSHAEQVGWIAGVHQRNTLSWDALG